MGVGLVRSLQPSDVLLIHSRIYNSSANTSKGVLFLPPSDAYVRSFLYLLYTLVKLYYTKALSNQACLWPWIEFFSSGGQESRRLFMVQQQPFNPLDYKEIKTVNPKGNHSKYSFEGQMLKLKLQEFGHLMRRVDSLGKTLMLGKAGREGDNRG